MTAIYYDNFDAYGANINFMLDGVAAGINGCSLVADPDPLASGNVLSVVSSLTSNSLTVVMPVARAGVGIATRVWMPALPVDANEGAGCEWRDAGNNTILAWRTNTIGGIDVRSSLSGGVIYASTPGPVVTAHAWYHVEAKAVFGVNTCTVEIRVEGVVVLTATFAVAGTLTCQIVGWGTASFNLRTNQFKDIVIWDTTGALNNNFLGSVVVKAMNPNSDVVVGGWVPSVAGPSYAMLDDRPPVDGTDYLSSAVPVTTPVRVGMTDLPADVTSVRALRTLVRARKIDGGDGNMQVSLVSGASTGAGANRPITAAFTYWSDMFETDPATAAAWALAAANAAVLKIDRTV